MFNIQQAVILGAGLGSRLKGIIDDRPICSKILTAFIEPEDENYCYSVMHDFFIVRCY